MRKRKVSISNDENNAEVWSTKRERILNQSTEQEPKIVIEGEDTPAKIAPKMKQGAITSYFSTPKREKEPLPISRNKPKKNHRKSLPDSSLNKMRGYWVQLAQTRRAKKCGSITHEAPICKALDTAATEPGHHILVHHSGPDNPTLIPKLHNDISYPKGLDNKK